MQDGTIEKALVRVTCPACNQEVDAVSETSTFNTEIALAFKNGSYRNEAVYKTVSYIRGWCSNSGKPVEINMKEEEQNG